MLWKWQTIFITQPLSCFVFHLPNILLTQNFVYPTLFSSVPPPAINNERSLIQNQLVHLQTLIRSKQVPMTAIVRFLSLSMNFVVVQYFPRSWVDWPLCPPLQAWEEHEYLVVHKPRGGGERELLLVSFLYKSAAHRLWKNVMFSMWRLTYPRVHLTNNDSGMMR